MSALIRERWRGRAGTLAAVATLGLGACDFEVTNPGPVEDAFLNEEAAFKAVVNGIPRSLSGALNWIAVDGAIRTRELHATQANEYVGVYIESHRGTVNPEFDAGYSGAGNARWSGDDAIRRLEAALGTNAGKNPHLARAYLWTGYAYRTMAEFFCEVTVDGGPPMPSGEFLKVAEQRFTKAMEIGAAAGLADVAMAARAGRASVRVDQGKWAEAVADADLVPTDFKWILPYYRQGDFRYYNALHWYSANQPYRALTVWNTPYEEYYQRTKDPRAAWKSHDIQFGGGSLAPFGPVPWLTQQKHPSPESPIRMSSGREMRLIKAEAEMRAGRIGPAMAIINELRTSVGVAPWPNPASLEEAWSFLKRERGIELWLEGRRLFDLRRWKEGNVPGALTPQEMGLTRGGPDLSNRALCVGIPNSERHTNPHLKPL